MEIKHRTRTKKDKKKITQKNKDGKNGGTRVNDKHTRSEHTESVHNSTEKS